MRTKQEAMPTGKQGFVNIIVLVVIGILVILGGYAATKEFVRIASETPTPLPIGSPTPPAGTRCTAEAMQCPDGSYVSRTGPKCEFAACPSHRTVPPSAGVQCTKDADCPSAHYTCEATQGAGTVSPNGGPSTVIIVKGECKLKAGGACNSDTACAAGLVCHAGTCTSPVGQKCSGPNDTSCASGYVCVQSCGPPMLRGGEPPAPYFCELKEVAAKPRNCPICLAQDSMIDAPNGSVAVQNMREGMTVWTRDVSGNRVRAIVRKTTKTPVPATHHVVHLILNDGRELFVSPNHPTADNRRVSDLKAGDSIDGALVRSTELVPYAAGFTYDILPSGATGDYWANNILMGSTLR